MFLADSAAIMERIEKVLAGRDYHEFRSLVHAMKGSSASMGTDRLTRTWVAPALGYLPVKAERIRDNKVEFSILIESVD